MRTVRHGGSVVVAFVTATALPGLASGFEVTLLPPATHSADTAAMDAALGITGLVIEDFEDVDLVAGLRVATSSPDSTATSILPRTYIDGSDAFFGNAWDGPGALVNTVNNLAWCCSGPGTLADIAQRRTFLVPGVRRFGVGLGNFQADIADHALLVNGVEVVPAIEALPGFESGVNVRNGYLVVTAGPGEVIDSVAFELRANGTGVPVSGAAGDGLIFDRVAFEPSSGLGDLTLRSSTVAGCRSVTGTVTLTEPAPAGGRVVSLADTLEAATLPATVTVREGTTSRSFTLRSAAVAETVSGTVSATLGGTTLTRPLTLRPIGVRSVRLAPRSVVGGGEVAGSVSLECAAGPGPIEVALDSSQPDTAAVTPALLTIAAGESAAAFTVLTEPVLSTVRARISASANDITKGSTLYVTTPVQVTPTRLTFGPVPVGTSGGPLAATVANRGTAAFAITGIALGGTGARYFAQDHDCPATLEPGESCTVRVTFTPADTRGRSARVVVATDVANPVSISLSGSGVLPP